MNNGIKSFRRDPKLVTRMYFTMFMLGILYAGFSFFLMSLGIPIRFVIILVGIMAIFQYLSFYQTYFSSLMKLYIV